MKNKKVIAIITVIIFVCAVATILGIIFIERPAFSNIKKMK